MSFLQQLCRNLYAGDLVAQSEARNLLTKAFPDFGPNDSRSEEEALKDRSLVQQRLGFSPSGSPHVSCTMLQELVEAPDNDVFCLLFAFHQLRQIILHNSFVLPVPFRLQLVEWMYRIIVEKQMGEPVLLSAALDAVTFLARVDYFESGQALCRLLESGWNPTGGGVAWKVQTWKVTQRLVETMNAPVNKKFGLAKHRKAANHFRDSFLLRAVTTAGSTLKDVSNLSDSLYQQLVTVVLGCLTKCVNFDFLGTNTEDAAEDLGSIQVPNSWRAFLNDSSFWQTLTNVNRMASAAVAVALALAELFHALAGIRRSIFSDSARVEFITWIFSESFTLVKLHGQSQLSSEPILFNFCLTVARIAAVHAKQDLAKCANIDEALDFIGNLSLHVFDPQKWADNVDANWFQTTIYHLLSFWEKMVLHVDFVLERPAWQTKILEMVKFLAQKFVQAGVSCCDQHADFMADELNEEGSVAQLLGCLAPMIRRSYPESGTMLLQLFQQTPPQSLARAWLIHTSAAVIGSRSSYRSPVVTEHDPMDALLTMQIVTGAHTSARLSFSGINATLLFFSQFRKSCFAETERSSSLYEHFDDAINTQAAMVEFIIYFINNVLQTFPHNSPLCTKAIELFSELGAGFSGVRMLAKTKSVSLLLQSPFLLDKVPGKVAEWLIFPANRKARSLLLQTLTNVLCAGQEQSQFEVEFYQFLTTFDNLQKERDLMFTNVDHFEHFCKDVRAIASSITHEIPFHLLLHWFLPVSHTLKECAIGFLEGSTAGRPLSPSYTLGKLWVELTLNRGKRLNFPLGNPKSVLLVREMCAAIEPLLLRSEKVLLSSLNTQESDTMLKIVRSWYELLSNVLRGKYVSVGNMKLYGDASFEQVLQAALLTLTMLPDYMNLFENVKLADACFTFLETLSRDHIFGMDALPAKILDSIVMLLLCVFRIDLTLENQTKLLNSACLCLENILTWVQAKAVQITLTTPDVLCSSEVSARFDSYFRLGDGNSLPLESSTIPQKHWLVSFFFDENSAVTKRILQSLVRFALIDEDCSFTWTVSRPITVYVVMMPGSFVSYLDSLVRVQLPECKQPLHRALAAFLQSLHAGIVTHLNTQSNNALATLGASSSSLHLHSSTEGVGQNLSRQNTASSFCDNASTVQMLREMDKDEIDDQSSLASSFPSFTSPIVIHDRLKDLVHHKISYLKREISSFASSLLFPPIV